MNRRKNELDVDFIGGEGPLTEQEKKALNDYFIAQKANKTKLQPVSKKRVTKQAKALA